MAGGSCEATAFAALGLRGDRAVPGPRQLSQHGRHRRGPVRASGKHAWLPKQISLADFHGLVDLLEAVALGLDSGKSKLPQRLRKLYAEEKHILE